jgi:hypothetical protein
MPFDQLGRLLIVGGLVLAGIGVVFLLLGRIPGLGRLPGDFVFQRDNVTIYIPLATMIILSLLLTLVLNLFFRR